jgi:hypothetical protein
MTSTIRSGQHAWPTGAETPESVTGSTGQSLNDWLLRTHMEPGSLNRLDIPGGWHLRHHMDMTGRRCIEVYDISRELAGFVTSTDQPHVSIGAAWRGIAEGPHGNRRWWTLAIGHATLATQTRVTFASRDRRGGLLRTTVSPPAARAQHWRRCLV